MNYEIVYDIGNSNGYLQVFVHHNLNGENSITKLAYLDKAPLYSFMATPVMDKDMFTDLPYIIDFDQ